MNDPYRIGVVLTYKHDPGDTEIFTERVDAEKDGEYYKVIHVPAFAPNLAYGDLIQVVYDEGEFHFDELIKESGYSVVHIVIFQLAAKEQLISTLNQFCCGINAHVAENYLVLSIPPTVFYQPIQTYLMSEKSNDNIDFRESCISKLHTSTQN